MRTLFIIFFSLFGVTLFSQDITVKSWLDTSKIYIGDQVFFNIEVNQPAGMVLNISQPSDTLVSQVNILSSDGPDTLVSGAGMLTITSKYLVTSFDTGSYDIAPVFAEVTGEPAITRYYSDYTHLDVIRTGIMPSDTTDVIFDIVGPMREKITAGEILPWLLLVLFIVLAVIVIVRRIRAKRASRSDVDESRIPGEPIHIMIMRELDKLERQQLWQKGEIKEFYSRLTEILRRYIDLRYTISSLEMTTSETLAALIKQGVSSDENFDRIENILTTADLSKFAKYAPAANINEGMIELAKLYVKESCKNNTDDNEVKAAVAESRKEDSNE